MTELTRYRNTENGIEFCHYSIHNESQKDKKVFLIQFNCGQLGTINESEVEIDVDLKKIKTLEDELLTKYPIESIPKKIFSLKINLNNFKGEISDSLLGKISRSVDWLLKHSGLGRIDHCFLNEVFVYCIALESVPTEKIQKLLSDDLIHLGILQTHITIN